MAVGAVSSARLTAVTVALPPAAVEPFALGITEADPHLLAPGPQPAPFAGFRDRLASLGPSYVRVLVDWSHVQPAASRPPDWTAPHDGCMRGRPPCAPWNGIAATLRAVAALGAEPVLVVYGTPAWAARPAEGCERAGTTPYARMPRLGDYRAFVSSLVALVGRLGIARATWSAWNEPNLPGFLNPQRGRCDTAAPTLAADRYAELVRALRGVLDATGARHRLLLGEAAGIPVAHPHATGAGELAGALPDDLVCGASAWAQHAHLVRPRDGGKRIETVPPADTDRILTVVERALARHGCDHVVPVWITETGAGDAPAGCELMAAPPARLGP